MSVPEIREVPLRPKAGDRVRLLSSIWLDGGKVLERGQGVTVAYTLPTNPYVVIRWSDDAGTHVMTIKPDKLRVIH